MKCTKRTLGLLLLVCSMLFLITACSAPEVKNHSVAPIHGSVIEIEKYGHAVLDITIEDFADAGYAFGDVVCVEFDDYRADMPYFNGYYVKPGNVMLRGKDTDETIAICINYGVFAEETGIQVGDAVTIALTEQAGALDLQEINSLKYFSYDRSDYASDAVFANFRPVTSGSIAEGVLYRSSSPIDNKNNRAKYANDCMEAAGVQTVVNLANSKEDIEALFLEEDFASEYYKSLYARDRVIALDLGANFYSDDFAKAMVTALTFLAEQDGPYLLHCEEGKDRAGFTSMLLAALMGASVDEIINDYMISFDNLFDTNAESEPGQYNAIVNNNLMEMLYWVTGAEDREALKEINLEEAVTKYLMDAGMEQATIEVLKAKLTA